MTWVSTVSGLGKTAGTLPPIGVDGEAVKMLLDRYGRGRLTYEDAAGNLSLVASSMALADTTLPVAVADGDPVQLLADVYGRPRSPYEDLSAMAVRGLEADPLDTRWVATQENDTAMASGAGTTYYYYFDMQYFRYISHQFVFSSALGDTMVLTAEITNEMAAPASCTYHDATLKLFGAATFTSSDYLAMNLAIPMRYMRLKLVLSGVNADGIFDLFSVKSY